MNAQPEPGLDALSSDTCLRELMRDIELGSGGGTLRAIKLDRRSFLKMTGLAGGGLVLGFSMGTETHAATQAAGEFAPNAFLRISRKGSSGSA